MSGYIRVRRVQAEQITLGAGLGRKTELLTGPKGLGRCVPFTILLRRQNE
jgi:hypothetical protein